MEDRVGGSGSKAGQLGLTRKLIKTRPDWVVKNALLGLTFHNNSDGSPYWGEGLVYELSQELAERVRTAAQELHNLCLKAAEVIINDDSLLTKLRIPEKAWSLVRRSWQAREKGIIGRFDIALDAEGVPKMFEYNADTPTTLLEAGIVQQKWAEEVYPAQKQINTIHEDLIARWKEIVAPPADVWVSCVANHEEDLRTVDYLRNTAQSAGLNARHLYIEHLLWNGSQFHLADGTPITTLFKLYPWEWLVIEPYSEHLFRDPCPIRMIEPAWKMVLSTKGLLPVLWQLFPNHPNLLPAFWTRAEAEAVLGKHFVEKPLLGREGQNVRIFSEQGTFERPGDYTDNGFVYQKVCLPHCINGNFSVIGAWVVGDKASGICLREERHPIICNGSMFVPHIITPKQ